MKNLSFSLILWAAAFVFFFPGFPLSAQEFDAAFGVTTLTAPSASSASGDHSPASLTGGAYPAFSAAVLLKHQLGFGGEIAWRGSQNLYVTPTVSSPYRPLFFDFDGVFAPKLTKHLTAEAMAGIGWESIRFYQPFVNCGNFGCTNYSSSNHFLGHVGGGLRFYVWGHLFVRPEAHLYLINNNFEFSSARAARFGVSIGYTFAPGF